MIRGRAFVFLPFLKAQILRDMNTPLLAISAFAALIWFVILALPWRPWRNGETLEPGLADPSERDLSGITVLIPARNESGVIVQTLRGLTRQGHGLKVVLVDDASDDGTAEIARQVAGLELTLVNSQSLPAGWSGKLWALEQGASHVNTDWTLLLDADIVLAPGMVAALLDKAVQDRRQFVSIMASLRMESVWEKLLMPAFVYFFKLLYPFRLANSAYPHVAAAAGGCILLETRLIAEIGGFAAIRGAIIDDCNLAKQVKQRGHRIWIGQSHAVVSSRSYRQLKPIWDMVARCAYTQLLYSSVLLVLCTVLQAALFIGPLLGILWGEGLARVWSVAAYAAMAVSYWPTLHYYRRNASWALLMPVIDLCFIGMTWTSAWRYWRGVRSHWKNRVYTVGE